MSNAALLSWATRRLPLSFSEEATASRVTLPGPPKLWRWGNVVQHGSNPRTSVVYFGSLLKTQKEPSFLQFNDPLMATFQPQKPDAESHLRHPAGPPGNVEYSTRAEQRWPRAELRELPADKTWWLAGWWVIYLPGPQRNVFWLVLCNKKPPKTFLLGFLEYAFHRSKVKTWYVVKQ